MATEALPAETRLASTSETPTLLIIDDEEEILKALRRQFRRYYTVYIASSAEEAYEIMTRVPVHVIISDQRMPGMTGSEFFKRVKTEYPDAIRLLLTGYSDIRAVIEAINDGNIYRYITKPWDAVELETIVREAFERYELIVQNRRLVEELKQANAMLEARVRERTAELAEANERLRALNEQKDRFMGIAAHDLRTPLAAIRGFTDLKLTGRADVSSYEEFLTIIDETTQDMLNLLNDLLDITTIETGQLALNPQTVDIAQFVERVAKLNRHMGEKKAIQLETDIAPDVREWTFDPRRIEQVLNNLLSNAFKYSYPNTTVWLIVRRVNNQLEFAVQDQGQGIKAEEQERLFGEFQRISTRPTGDEGSTGLGLSICKRIVELHNGQIGVESTYGAGSRFWFRLP